MAGHGLVGVEGDDDLAAIRLDCGLLAGVDVVGPGDLAAVIVGGHRGQRVQRQGVEEVVERGRPLGVGRDLHEDPWRGLAVLPVGLDPDQVPELRVRSVGAGALEPVGQPHGGAGPVRAGLGDRHRARGIGEGRGDPAVLLVHLVHAGVARTGWVADGDGDRPSRPVRPGDPEPLADGEDVDAVQLGALPVGGDGDGQATQRVVGVARRAAGRVGLPGQQAVVVGHRPGAAGRVGDAGQHPVGQAQGRPPSVGVDDPGRVAVTVALDGGDVAPPVGAAEQPAVGVVVEGGQHRAGAGGEGGDVPQVGAERPDLVAGLVRDAVGDRLAVQGAAQQRVVTGQRGQVGAAATEDDDLAGAVEGWVAVERLAGDDDRGAVGGDVDPAGGG